MPLTNAILLILLMIIMGGCASIDYTDYRQTILVISDPPGAKVYDREELVGATPGYMRVRRGRHATVKLVQPDGSSREVPLETSYRWADSFAMNTLFLIYAPVGWAVDGLTGTAWHLKDPPLQRFGKSDRWPEIRKPKVVAVAPPQGVDSDVAGALGMAVEEKLRSSEKFSVLDYQETAPLFQFYRSYSGLAVERENRYRLFSELQADYILHTTAEKAGERFIVKGELKDVVTTRTYSTYSWEITPGTETLKQKFTAESFVNEYFHVFPNSVFLNLSNYTPTVTINQEEFQGKEGPSNGLGDELLKYLSAISIARLEREQFNTRGHWLFAFVPTIIVSQKQIIFPSFAPASEAEFHRWYVSGGYGIEGGYMGRYGLVYADLIPTLTWSRIKYSTPQGEGSVSRLSVQAMVEIGYSYFFTDHLIGRIYFRNLGEDNKLWNHALSKVSGQDIFTDSVSSGFAGISIGYYIPTALKRRDGWLVRKTSR